MSVFIHFNKTDIIINYQDISFEVFYTIVYMSTYKFVSSFYPFTFT